MTSGTEQRSPRPRDGLSSPRRGKDAEPGDRIGVASIHARAGFSLSKGYYNGTGSKDSNPIAAGSASPSVIPTGIPPSDYSPSASNSTSFPTGTSSSDYSPSTSGDSENITCTDLLSLNASQKWDVVHGDDAVTKFIDMFNSNKLVCTECFGKSKEDCQSKREQCQNGIKDLSILPHTHNTSWTVAAAHFAQNVDASDLTCVIGPGTCSASPSCESSKTGLASYAVLKSLTTAHNSFQANYDALKSASDSCDTQMEKFSEVFAPVPNTENLAMFIIVFTAILGGLAGFIPGVGGALAGMATGLGAGIGLEQYFSTLPISPDAHSMLGTIAKKNLETYADLANTLFQTGTFSHPSSDGRKTLTISLQDLMSGGQLLEQDGDPANYFTNLQPTYEKILYQQLALVTWQNLEVDGVKHTPFIAFDTGACSDVDPKKAISVGNYYLQGVEKLDVHLDFQGNCYYLLDAKPYVNEETADGPICNGANALPGATHKDMTDNAPEFSNLKIEDFIIPSVLGWQNHSKTNGYQSAASNGNIIKDPQAPGVVNIPVCDIMANPDNPGVDCPKICLNTYKNKGCDLVPASEGKNEPGVYQQGGCRVHVEQWQKNEIINDVNLLNNYQLEIGIFDNDNRLIGTATKESAAKPLEVVNSELPYDVIVAPGAGDDDPVSFWYADQFWLSNTAKANQCHVGSYDSGSRKMDCTFDCPLPADPPPVSATLANPLPTAPVAAIAGPTSFVNTYSRPSPTGAAAAQATPTYASGTCAMHITQYQKNEKGSNPTGDYEVEVTIKDANGTPIDGAESGKVAAPSGKPVPVSGLKGPFTVTALGLDSDALVFNYNGDTFNSSTQENGPCSVGAFDSGDRNMDCNFSC